MFGRLRLNAPRFAPVERVKRVESSEHTPLRLVLRGSAVCPRVITLRTGFGLVTAGCIVN